MFTPYQSLTRLLVTVGEVRGRKKLQKMVFIAQGLGYGFPEPFDLHVWGPYSEVLAVKLKEMADWGFAAEAALPGPAGNQQYLYTPGPNADRLCDASAEPKGLTPLLHLLNEQDATFLEGAATVLFLRTKGKADADVRAMLTRLKPDKFTDPARIDAVMTFVDSLDAHRAS